MKRSDESSLAIALRFTFAITPVRCRLDAIMRVLFLRAVAQKPRLSEGLLAEAGRFEVRYLYPQRLHVIRILRRALAKNSSWPGVDPAIHALTQATVRPRFLLAAPRGYAGQARARLSKQSA
jgi:hypothetical protein